MSSITFAASPPGLHPLTEFRLEAIDGAAGLYALRAEAAPAVRLYAVDARHYVAGYEPDLSTAELAGLGAESVADVLLLVVVTPADDGPTVNLAAPVIVDLESGRAAQVILDGDWPIASPL
jgi:flagellar assembly factor FliW